MKTKQCSQCKQTLPLEDFPKEKRNKDGRVAQCKLCCNKRSNVYQATIEGRTNRLFNNARRRAKSRGGKCTITKEFIKEVLINGVDPDTDIPFVITVGKHAYAPSVDRIDTSNPDYSPDNTKVITYVGNCCKNQFGERDEKEYALRRAMIIASDFSEDQFDLYISEMVTKWKEKHPNDLQRTQSS